MGKYNSSCLVKSREIVEMPKKQVIDSHQKHNQKSHGSRKSSGGGGKNYAPLPKRKQPVQRAVGGGGFSKIHPSKADAKKQISKAKPKSTSAKTKSKVSQAKSKTTKQTGNIKPLKKDTKSIQNQKALKDKIKQKRSPKLNPYRKSPLAVQRQRKREEQVKTEQKAKKIQARVMRRRAKG